MKKTKTLQKSNQKSTKQPNTLKLLLSNVLKDYRFYLGIVILCIIISALASIMGTMFMQPLIDNFIEPLKNQINPDFSGLIKAILFMAGIYFAGILSTLTYSQLMVVVSQNSMRSIRDKMFVKMQKLPVVYFDRKNNGDIMSYFSNDTDVMLQMISQGIPQIINLVTTLIAVIVAMFMISPILAGVTLLYGVAMLFVAKTIGKKSTKYFAGQQQAISNVNAYVEEMISGQKVVKVFNHEEKCKQDFAKINDEWRDASFRAIRLSVSIMPIMNGMGHLLYVLLALIGGALVIWNVGTASVGGLAAFLMISRSFVMPINQFAEQINNIAMALAGSKRIFQLLSEEEEVDNGYVTLVKIKDVDGKIEECKDGEWAWKHPHGDGTLTYAKLEGNVQLDHVDFGYTDDKLVLKDITINAKAGEKIALVGSTGAGKTTITNLINRFYDIDDGKIRYDGININKIKKEDLRRSLGIVLQDVNLFTGTIAENIRYGRPDATDEEVISACKRGGAHEFIEMLPEKYDTVIDGEGSSLSQGQRQLLSISRAILADTPLMILDEATSSIDTRTELLVQKGMDSLMQGRTCFVIAHRLSTIKNSDCIMVLEHGEIIERGNHEQLIAKKGRYYELYNGIKAENGEIGWFKKQAYKNACFFMC